MKIYLIDFENVHSEGMTGVDLLSEDDEVVIFYSANADSISFDVLHKLMFCKAKLSYFKIRRGGKNALDFQLSSYLGYRLGSDPTAEFYIISRDSGFDFVLDFWSYGYVNLTPTLSRFLSLKAVAAWEAGQKAGNIAARADAAEAVVRLIGGNRDNSGEQTLEQAVAAAELIPAPKHRGRRKKSEILAEENAAAAAAAAKESEAAQEKPVIKIKPTDAVKVETEPRKKRAYTRKADKLTSAEKPVKPAKPVKEKTAAKEPKKRGRPAKSDAETAETSAEQTHIQPSTPATSSDGVKKRVPAPPSEEELRTISELSATVKNRHELFNMLQKQYGRKRGSELYSVGKFSVKSAAQRAAESAAEGFSGAIDAVKIVLSPSENDDSE